MTRKGRLCIVMDYADGGDIHMEVQKRKGDLMPEVRILEWFVQLCFAMHHVHERKVLHRDLKTQNVFLMKTGQVKLGDFGIARVLEFTKDYAKTMVGTPYYLSPEIIEDRPYNYKSDVWSLGVVLYEVTTLKHPFDADSLVVLASKILKDQYPPPDACYSEELRALIKNMLCKDAAQRPSIAQVLSLAFLQGPMRDTCQAFSLGVDLAQFASRGAPGGEPAPTPGPPPQAAAASAAPVPPPSPPTAARLRQEVPSATVTGPEAAPAAAATAPPALAAAAGPGLAGAGETVLIGTVRPAATGPAAASPKSQEPEEEEEDTYEEEEFEDYSGDEEPEMAVAERGPRLDGGDAAKASSDAAGASATGGGPPKAGLRAKAESLRAYLGGQVPNAVFEQAYARVRASGDCPPEVLQQQVTAIIGVEKASELFTLFQLLCFLEDVADGSTEAPS